MLDSKGATRTKLVASKRTSVSLAKSSFLKRGTSAHTSGWPRGSGRSSGSDLTVTFAFAAALGLGAACETRCFLGAGPWLEEAANRPESSLSSFINPCSRFLAFGVEMFPLASGLSSDLISGAPTRGLGGSRGDGGNIDAARGKLTRKLGLSLARSFPFFPF